MHATGREKLKTELDLITRFAGSYRRRFATLIDQLNHPTTTAPATDVQCIRMCVEAVDMMLSTQTQLAKAMSELNSERTPPA